ncbi:MAG: hypothetical protein IJZ42_13370 [Lachnospiraceae bacterium]|nr:hypothetical protein [Lachnospiraceae bacterium]
MKLKEYMNMRDPGDEVTCFDRDIDSEFYFYNKEVGKQSLFDKDFPNVNRCDELMKELLDVVKVHDHGIEVNLYELLDNPKVIDYAKKNMFEEHQYKDDSDVVILLFDDNVKNFSYGYEGFSELMVDCLIQAYLPEQSKDLHTKMLFHTSDNDLAKYNGTEVEIIRPLSDDECDIEDVGNMYKVRFHDGYVRDAFADELTSKPPNSLADRITEAQKEIQNSVNNDTIKHNEKSEGR